MGKKKKKNSTKILYELCEEGRESKPVRRSRFKRFKEGVRNTFKRSTHKTNTKGLSDGASLQNHENPKYHEELHLEPVRRSRFKRFKAGVRNTFRRSEHGPKIKVLCSKPSLQSYENPNYLEECQLEQDTSAQLRQENELLRIKVIDANEKLRQMSVVLAKFQQRDNEFTTEVKMNTQLQKSHPIDDGTAVVHARPPRPIARVSKSYIKAPRSNIANRKRKLYIEGDRSAKKSRYSYDYQDSHAKNIGREETTASDTSSGYDEMDELSEESSFSSIITEDSDIHQTDRKTIYGDDGDPAYGNWRITLHQVLSENEKQTNIAAKDGNTVSNDAKGETLDEQMTDNARVEKEVGREEPMLTNAIVLKNINVALYEYLNWVKFNQGVIRTDGVPSAFAELVKTIEHLARVLNENKFKNSSLISATK